MQVTEIFKSIQGESTHAGLPCIFVRFTGCNLRCTWCDTAYAFYGGRQMSLDEVLSCVREFSRSTTTPDADPVKLVELTGGEPLLQAEATQLAERLLAEGYTVLVETSGERYIGRLPRAVIKIVDIKCPDSGEGGTFDMANLEALGAQDEVKFVIASRRDYDFARGFVQQHKLAARVRQILFSAVHPDPEEKWPGLDARQLAEWILADNLPVRLGLQLHKIIWDPATKGV
jgi:7-carboxy-7-deazaguanine synthase